MGSKERVDFYFLNEQYIYNIYKVIHVPKKIDVIYTFTSSIIATFTYWLYGKNSSLCRTLFQSRKIIYCTLSVKDVVVSQ